LSCLALLLVLREEHVVGQTAAWNSTLEAHAVTLARQAPGTKATVGQGHSALLLDIDRALWLGALVLGLVLFLLLGIGRLVCVAIQFALFALDGTICIGDGTLCGGLAGWQTVVFVALFLAEGRILSLLGLLLLLQLLLFLVQAITDVGSRGGA